MSAPLVTIIILNWNGQSDTVECLESVSKLDYPNFAVIVVDNGSTDDSVQAVRNRFPVARILETGRNLGYAGGNNAGIREALKQTVDYILLLNNDTIVDRVLLKHLVAAAQSIPEAGIFGAKIYFYSDPKTLWYAGGEWKDDRSCFTHRGYGQVDVGNQFNDIIETDFVTGCALLIKREVIEAIGLLDEEYYLTFEESDWCYRARRQGYKSFFVPEATLWHKVAASFGGESSPLRTYFSFRNRLLWAEKNLGFSRRVAIHLATYAAFGSRFIRPIFVKNTTVPMGLKQCYWNLVGSFKNPVNKAWLCGVRDYWLRRFGDCPDRIRDLNRQWDDWVSHAESQ